MILKSLSSLSLIIILGCDSCFSQQCQKKEMRSTKGTVSEPVYSNSDTIMSCWSFVTTSAPDYILLVEIQELEMKNAVGSLLYFDGVAGTKIYKDRPEKNCFLLLGSNNTCERDVAQHTVLKIVKRCEEKLTSLSTEKVPIRMKLSSPTDASWKNGTSKIKLFYRFFNCTEYLATLSTAKLETTTPSNTTLVRNGSTAAPSNEMLGTATTLIISLVAVAGLGLIIGTIFMVHRRRTKNIKRAEVTTAQKGVRRQDFGQSSTHVTYHTQDGDCDHGDRYEVPLSHSQTGKRISKEQDDGEYIDFNSSHPHTTYQAIDDGNAQECGYEVLDTQAEILADEIEHQGLEETPGYSVCTETNIQRNDDTLEGRRYEIVDVANANKELIETSGYTTCGIALNDQKENAYESSYEASYEVPDEQRGNSSHVK